MKTFPEAVSVVLFEGTGTREQADESAKTHLNEMVSRYHDLIEEVRQHKAIQRIITCMTQECDCIECRKDQLMTAVVNGVIIGIEMEKAE